MSRHEREGQKEGKFSSVHQEYYTRKHYGRAMARGPAGQKLTPLEAAFGSFCVVAVIHGY